MKSLIVDQRIELTYISLIDSQKMFSIIDSQRAYLREWLPWVDITLREEDVRNFYEICEQKQKENNGFDALLITMVLL